MGVTRMYLFSLSALLDHLVTMTGLLSNLTEDAAEKCPFFLPRLSSAFQRYKIAPRCNSAKFSYHALVSISRILFRKHIMHLWGITFLGWCNCNLFKTIFGLLHICG